MHEYYAQKNGKVYYAITSHDPRENDTNKSEVSKYQIISQPKLDKFQLQRYSKCSKWRPKFDHVAETDVYMKTSSATRQRGARTLGAHQIN